MQGVAGLEDNGKPLGEVLRALGVNPLGGLIMKIHLESPVNETPRVLQVRGMFDLPPAKTSSVHWEVVMPLDEKPWNIGLIVGPSGCGKSTIARHVWPDAIVGDFDWPGDAAILDGFPPALPTKDVVEILSCVGFASPPAWLRPFHVLSTGQQFRVTLARCIAACGFSARKRACQR